MKKLITIFTLLTSSLSFAGQPKTLFCDSSTEKFAGDVFTTVNCEPK